jgi:hypothetical protein
MSWTRHDTGPDKPMAGQNKTDNTDRKKPPPQCRKTPEYGNITLHFNHENIVTKSLLTYPIIKVMIKNMKISLIS